MKTTYVIGAGASKEANLPTGDELKTKIANLLDIRFDYRRQESGDHLLTDALRLCTQDIEPYINAAWHIRDALPLAISIDNLIDSQRGDEKIALCGKLAIVRSILEAEKSSTLFIDKLKVNPKLNFNQLNGTWYVSIFKHLAENCGIEELKIRLKDITFVVFNYDRCFEHFLLLAIQEYYRLSETQAVEIIRELSIFHPYGSVGQLPWQNQIINVPFGTTLSTQSLLDTSSKIKTFTEGVDPEESEILEIKSRMADTDRLIFIGFAFHKLNMELLSLKDARKKESNVDCFATAYGISKPDQAIVCNLISDIYGTHVDTFIDDLSAEKFFNTYWRSLAFS